MLALKRWVLLLVVILLGASPSLRGGQSDGPELAAAVQNLVAARSPTNISPAVWTDVRAFYGARNHAPAWTVDRHFTKANAVLQVLRESPEDGFPAAHYGEPAFTRSIDLLKSAGRNATPAQLADLDVRLTAALLLLARDVALGVSKPERTDRRWKNQRSSPAFAQGLAGVVDGDVKGWIRSLRPTHPQYAALQKALGDLYAAQKRGGWSRVPARSLEPGATGPAVEALRQRLAGAGYLAAPPAQPAAPPPPAQPSAGTKNQQAPAASAPAAVYDKEVEAGVRAFQEHHGLKPTGVADRATVSAMNVAIGTRIQQIAINMDRWRWTPVDFGARHVLVNIPSFRLYVHENSALVDTMKVVVGKADGRHHTPVFSAPMHTVVFSPYWNIPDTIVEGETAPAVLKDPAYLSRNNIEVLRVTKSGAVHVDPSTVDWSDAAQLKELAVRQRPGSDNALGHMKFLIQNDFDIYLHDTPADNLFAREGRAFSHGCVRLEQPDALAKYVLRDYPEWDDASIRAAGRSGVEKAVKLKEPLPVHIVYFTAWVDDAGGLHHYPDIYRYDGVRR